MNIKFNASGNIIRGVSSNLDFFPTLESFQTYADGTISEITDKDSVIKETGG